MNEPVFENSMFTDDKSYDKSYADREKGQSIFLPHQDWRTWPQSLQRNQMWVPLQQLQGAKRSENKHQTFMILWLKINECVILSFLSVGSTWTRSEWLMLLQFNLHFWCIVWLHVWLLPLSRFLSANWYRSGRSHWFWASSDASMQKICRFLARKVLVPDPSETSLMLVLLVGSNLAGFVSGPAVAGGGLAEWLGCSTCNLVALGSNPPPGYSLDLFLVALN